MFYYFAYGSNINSIALKAKGVNPKSSVVARLQGWKLAFNVQHWFKHEGGMANIVNTNQPQDRVEGVLHLCVADDLKKLDQLEAYGIGYDRIEVNATTKSEDIIAFAYIGLPGVLDNTLKPTKRYKNIILKGALEHNLNPTYIETLKHQPVTKMPKYPRFEFNFDKRSEKIYTTETLSKSTHLTALSGYVFDMRNSREELKSLFNIFGGKDTTLFHLKRLDSSDGKETLNDITNGTIGELGKEYINTYLHAYQKEFECVGRLIHNNKT